MYRRFHDTGEILDMTFSEYVPFIKRAREVERDERIYSQWLAQLPYLKKEHLQFEVYRDQLTGQSVDNRPVEEIIKEINQLHGKEVVNIGS